MHDWKQTRLVAVFGFITSSWTSTSRASEVLYKKPQMWTLLWRSMPCAW